MKRNILKYVSVFLVYFIVDVTYQISIGISWSQQLQQAAGIDHIYQISSRAPAYMLLWFFLMTLGIVKLVVEPAVEKGGVKAAICKGILLGLVAYGTLALPNGWSIGNYPGLLIVEVLLEGFLFTPIAAGFTTWWLIKVNQRS